MQERLSTDEDLQRDYQAAHEHYLATCNAMGGPGTEFSAVACPIVKCLHVHGLCAGRGPERLRLGTETGSGREHDPSLSGTAIPADYDLRETGHLLVQATVEGGRTPACSARARTRPKS